MAVVRRELLLLLVDVPLVAAINTSLLMQLRKSCGTRPPIALRTSRAANSRNSWHDTSEYHAECGVHIKFGAFASGPANERNSRRCIANGEQMHVSRKDLLLRLAFRSHVL